MRKKTHKKLALDLHEESSDLIYLFCKCKQLFLEKKTQRETVIQAKAKTKSTGRMNVSFDTNRHKTIVSLLVLYL